MPSVVVSKRNLSTAPVRLSAQQLSARAGLYWDRESDFFRRFGFGEVNKEIFPQKIWKDCLHCRYANDCKETAMQVEVS